MPTETTATDEFWGGIWRVSDGKEFRNATPGECAAEIKRLRGIIADIARTTDCGLLPAHGRIVPKMASPNQTTAAGQVWMTLEDTPRKLTVRGQSGIDPDCLVAYEEGSTRALWIVIGSNPECFVCGLGVRAVQETTSQITSAALKDVTS